MNKKQTRILVADDEPRALESVKTLITMHGHEVATASNGKDAIAQLKGQHFDVLLLDLMMPDVDGLEVMDFVQQNGLDVSVIVVSGDTSVENAILSLRRGAHDYLRKPYAPEVLVRTLENTLKKRLLERENLAMEGKLRQSEKLYRYMVNSSPDFEEQAKVVDGASDLFVELFGEAGRHSRSAPGMAALPGNTAVIVDCVIEIAED